MKMKLMRELRDYLRMDEFSHILALYFDSI